MPFTVLELLHSNPRLLMKLSVGIFLLAISAVLPSTIAGESLTADDLARHLHISAWESTVDPASGTFIAAVLHVVHGKVAETLTGGLQGPKDDPHGQRLVVMASLTPLGTKVTLVIGGSSCYSADDPKAAKIEILGQMGLPANLKEGDHCLGGKYRMKNGAMMVEDKIESLEDGLLLRITRVTPAS